MQLRDNLPFTVSDMKAAGADYLAQRISVRPSAHSHPTAENMLDEGVSLAEVAATFGYRELLQRKARLGPAQAISAGITTSDFADVLTGAIRQLVAATYQQETDYRRIAKLVDAPNFHEVSFPSFDLTASLPKILEDSAYRHRATIKTNSGETAAVESYGALITISRETIVNDDVGLINAVFAQFAAAAYRLESAAVFGVLEANPTLADSSAMFTGSNLLNTGSFGQAKLGEAFSALRRQTGAAGSAANNQPALLIVSPELEVDALALVATLSNTGRALQVVANPSIADKHWYLLADPARSPVVGLLHLGGAPNAVRIERAPRWIGSDGVAVKIAVDYGATALGRVGAIRCEDA